MYGNPHNNCCEGWYGWDIGSNVNTYASIIFFCKVITKAKVNNQIQIQCQEIV